LETVTLHTPTSVDVPAHHIELRIRRAGILIVIGLVLQVLTLLSVHPLAFMAFLLVACPLVGIGILLYLYTLVTPRGEPGAKAGN
jgi:hypothetical protein